MIVFRLVQSPQQTVATPHVLGQSGVGVVIGIEAPVGAVPAGGEAVVIHEIVGGESDDASEEVGALETVGDGEG